MQAEQIEIASLLKQYAPFNELPPEIVDEIATKTEISYYRAGTVIFKYDEPIHEFCVLRSGVVELYRRSEKLFARLTSGDIFGQWGLMRKRRVRYPATATRDCLIYFLPESVFEELFERFECFAEFMETKGNVRLRQAVENQHKNKDLPTVKVMDLIHRKPVLIDIKKTAQQAAILMAKEEVSSLLVTTKYIDDENQKQTQLSGIVTDKDLRTRVLAQALPYDTPISEIYTTDLVMLDSDAYVSEAMLIMLRHNLHHLPVVKDQQPIGVLGLSEILRYESNSSLIMVSSIYAQKSVDELATLSLEVKQCFTRLVAQDANSHMVGSALAVIGRSFKQRLLELAEIELGEPPIPYCFLAMGSMARDEQLIVTDQDNAIILDDNYNPKLHDKYFSTLAQFVCDGLARCGYNYCTGEIMATNPAWRKTRKEWEQCFVEWIHKPSPQSLLDSNIFFDLDGVYGVTQWADRLKAIISNEAKSNYRFLAAMAHNALNRTPPLGFFKNFVVEKNGKQKKSINLKRRGTAPLADLIRVHSLAIGSLATNSFARINDIIEADILPKGRGEDLRDALEFISMVRIRHQANNVELGEEPNNSIEPEYLSDFERRNLKEAFQILSNAQKFLRFRYHPNRKN